jgi:alkylhydroperoxidase/carboxymuconolactone decarboxylase family protein YurZ
VGPAQPVGPPLDDLGKRMDADTAGEANSEAQHQERKAALIEKFRSARGYFDPIWDDILDMDLDFFEQYQQFSSVPWKSGAIDGKTKELIAIALCASVTHLYEPGIRVHIRQALNKGATKQEIMEVFELVAVLGVHSLTIGLPMLVEELAAAEQPER